MPNAMSVLKAEVAEVIKGSGYSEWVHRKIITFVCNAARRTRKRVPYEVLTSELEKLLEMSPNMTHKTLKFLDRSFRASLTKRYGIRSSTLDDGHQRLVNLLIKGSHQKSAHLISSVEIYRFKTLWCILNRFRIARIDGPVDHLACLFPSDILEFILVSEKYEWENFLGSWVVQMFYFQKGILVGFVICSEIWKIFSSWEKAAELPLEITLLDLETLATFLPPSEILGTYPPCSLMFWRLCSEPSALCRLCAFPFRGFETQPDYGSCDPCADALLVE
eukprot:TRINITY_DN1696_c0_g1_i2.p1 TRINITY_DN1696_c0_g1~~TRINITY_DN1696_c0_g1_i2.p1  ORF type:complete len:293 (+),score=25.51 TRINITY_DN1696_c0_g1_i2:50-880(+)